MLAQSRHPVKATVNDDWRAPSSVSFLQVFFSAVSISCLILTSQHYTHTNTLIFFKKCLPFHVFCGKCGFLNRHRKSDHAFLPARWMNQPVSAFIAQGYLFANHFQAGECSESQMGPETSLENLDLTVHKQRTLSSQFQKCGDFQNWWIVLFTNVESLSARVVLIISFSLQTTTIPE